MTLRLPVKLLHEIQVHGESSYPDEGAGLLLGSREDEVRTVEAVLPIDNTFEEGQRGHRYLIDPQAMIQAEQEADAQGRTILAVFHSHPDHPARPSDYDLRMALPWFVYLITSIESGEAGQSRAWRLTEDREGFEEVRLQIDRTEEEAA